MYFLALAADYDGTVAHHGAMTSEARDALRRLKETGRRLVLVTGRELADLRHSLSELLLFDRVVAENGAVIYNPAIDETRSLAPGPPVRLVQTLMERNVEPISVGHSIVATWQPHETTVLGAIRELGLELQIIFNKSAIMILPPGINKASGLKAALVEMDISAHNVVAVGDAENDHAFLRLCGCSAAVENALPSIKEEADLRLSKDHGAGVAELVERIVLEDNRLIPVERVGLLVGHDQNGGVSRLRPDRNVLIVGHSGSGKSRFAKLLSERMVEKQFEFCAIDPEGDHQGLDNAVAIGNSATLPTCEEALRLLRETEVNLVVNLVSLNTAERKQFCETFLAQLSRLRARTGRPQWLLIDEAHQLVSTSGDKWTQSLKEFPATVFITVSPELLPIEVIRTVDTILAFGHSAADVMSNILARAGDAMVSSALPMPASNEILFWSRSSNQPPRIIRIDAPRQSHTRHTGKYAEGDVGEHRSFYFRGPGNKHNLRARNLMHFLEHAQRIDDATWEHHLRAGDFSAWFRHVIKDEALACETCETESDRSLGPLESRARIRTAITRRYAAPVQ